jgi:hypothetical protein
MAHPAAAELNERSIGGRIADAMHPSTGWLPKKLFVPSTRRESLVPGMVAALRRAIRTVLMPFSPIRSEITRKLMMSALIIIRRRGR